MHAISSLVFKLEISMLKTRRALWSIKIEIKKKTVEMQKKFSTLTISNYLLGYKKKLEIWMHQELAVKNVIN